MIKFKIKNFEFQKKINNIYLKKRIYNRRKDDPNFLLKVTRLIKNIKKIHNNNTFLFKFI